MLAQPGVGKWESLKTTVSFKAGSTHVPSAETVKSRLDDVYWDPAGWRDVVLGSLAAVKSVRLTSRDEMICESPGDVASCKRKPHLVAAGEAQGDMRGSSGRVPSRCIFLLMLQQSDRLVRLRSDERRP